MIKQRQVSDEEQANWDRYVLASQAMQSGVRMMMNYDMDTETAGHGPKKLRVGVNAAMVQNSALADLLISKGIITGEEYSGAVADFMEAEVKTYEKEIKQKIDPTGQSPTEIRLG